MTGQDLKELRLEAELLQADVARELGITHQSVADVEGSQRIRRETSQKYLRAIATAIRRRRIAEVLDGKSVTELSA